MTDRRGKIVVCNDEWTLSDTGFQQSPDAGSFATNIAGWFSGGRAGKFLVYSTNFGLTQSSLASALRAAGHALSFSTSIQFDVPTLLGYDGVFLAGNSADNGVLIDYVKEGGCVLLEGGTGWGDGQAEADRWKTLLNAFGMKFSASYNLVSGNIPINVDHPIFKGVGRLYQNNGNPIAMIDPESPVSRVLVSNSTGGLYAVADMSLAPDVVYISDIYYVGKVDAESDEYVEITNGGLSHMDMSGWRLHAREKNVDFRFPQGALLRSGQFCRVYTNQVHPETGGYTFGSKQAIWSNTTDEGLLYDAHGHQVSTFSYKQST
jgi:hypothetical protein